MDTRRNSTTTFTVPTDLARRLNDSRTMLLTFEAVFELVLMRYNLEGSIDLLVTSHLTSILQGLARDLVHLDINLDVEDLPF